MSGIFIRNIVGSGAYDVPDNDTQLTNATSGLDALLSGIAGLTYDSANAWVTTDDDSGTRYLNCNINDFTYGGSICPSITDSTTLMALINSTLVADPDITSINQIDMNLENTPDYSVPAHKTTHQDGGSDEIDVTGLSGVLADPQTPVTHASTHLHNGADEIDGDTIDVTYTPTDYVRTTTIYAPNAEEVSAHLAGIDIKTNDFEAYAVINDFLATNSTPEQTQYSAFNLSTNLPMSKFAPSVYSANTNATRLGVYETTAWYPHRVSERPSWVLLQAPNTTHRCVLYKADPFVLFTELVYMARLKFNQKSSVVSGDGDVGFFWGAESGGSIDRNNYLAAYLNKSSTNHQAEFWRYNAGVPGQIGTSTNTSLAGTALEYAAIHRINNDYHAWVGTAVGNWIHLGSVNWPAFSPAYIGIICQNSGIASPGTTIVACDWIKVYTNTIRFLV